MAYQRVEILTGTERRRNYTPAEKVRIVEEAFRPGVIVKDVARRLGIHESLLEGSAPSVRQTTLTLNLTRTQRFRGRNEAQKVWSFVAGSSMSCPQSSRK